MGQGDSARDFDTIESMKNVGILDVFPIFHTAQLGQKIRRSLQLPLCGVAQDKGKRNQTQKPKAPRRKRAGRGFLGGGRLWRRECDIQRLPLSRLLWLLSLAPLKTTLLRFGQIFCPNNSFWKHRNTQSIPVFPKLLLEQNLSPKPSKSSF